jgi:hypothetical protein
MRFLSMSVFLFALFFTASTARAQPTSNILECVLMVQSQNERGTMFSLDVDQREYWITASISLQVQSTLRSGLFLTNRYCCASSTRVLRGSSGSP